MARAHTIGSAITSARRLRKSCSNSSSVIRSKKPFVHLRTRLKQDAPNRTHTRKKHASVPGMGHALVHFIQRLFYGNTPLVDESRIPVTKQTYTLEIIPHLYDSSLFVMQIFLKMKFSTNSYKPSSLGYFIASRYEIRAWLASLLIDDFLAPATSALLSLLTALLRLRGRAPRRVRNASRSCTPSRLEPSHSP